MDKLKAIYNILNSLEKNNQEYLEQKLTKEEIIQIIKIMKREDLVTLKRTKIYINEDKNDLYKYENIEITMKGLQYRKENSVFNKVMKVVKEGKDFIK